MLTDHDRLANKATESIKRVRDEKMAYLDDLIDQLEE